MGNFTRAYDFLAQIIDCGDTDRGSRDCQQVVATLDHPPSASDTRSEFIRTRVPHSFRH